MTLEQILIFAVLAATIILFLWGRWRHDMVALAALLGCVALGLVPAEQAFLGFGHPAVITVAAVLVLSYGLQTTGAVDALAQRAVPATTGPTLTIATLVALGAFLSAFMNNVGAMALLMPVAVHVANRHQLPAGKVLMPLAFGTILGGMTTLIGTPPNLVVSGFRAGTGAGSFGMFDFSPVGVAVLAVGITFIAAIGWRLVPARQPAGGATFDTGSYFTEARVVEDSKAVGATLRELEAQMGDADAQIVGMIRNEFHVSAPNPGRILREDDILIIEAEPEGLATVLSKLGLKLEEEVAPPKGEENEADVPVTGAPSPAVPARQARAGQEPVTADAGGPGAKQKPDGESRARERREIMLQELVAMPGSNLVGRSASDVMLRTRYGLNLLALSRQGRRSIKRLRSTPILSGDVLLMQGTSESLAAFAGEYNCVPLAQRAVRIPDQRKAMLATLVMITAIGGAAFGLVPAAVSFVAGMLAYMAIRIVPPRNIYDAIDWPVIVLLASLIPVAGAFAATGAADLLARLLLDDVAQGHPVAALAIILVISMTLSDFMNNAATAAVMCPIAISAAAYLGVNVDTYLMAVAIGASCAFLTPIGHQNNTLILGPGGFGFSDYWRLGLPLEAVVVAVGVPMLLLIWPL